MPRRTSLLRWLLPAVIALLWLGLAGPLGSFSGKLAQVSENDSAAFLPDSAESTRVTELQEGFRTERTLPVILLWESEDGALDEATLAEVAQRVDDAVAVAEGRAPWPARPPRRSRPRTAPRSRRSCRSTRTWVTPWARSSRSCGPCPRSRAPPPTSPGPARSSPTSPTASPASTGCCSSPPSPSCCSSCWSSTAARSSRCWSSAPRAWPWSSRSRSRTSSPTRAGSGSTGRARASPRSSSSARPPTTACCWWPATGRSCGWSSPASPRCGWR